MTAWNFEPIFGNYLAIVFLGLLGFIVFFFIRLDRQLSIGKRLTLNLLRLLTLAILLFAMLRPGVTFTNRQAPHQSVAVLIDTSASMQLPSGVTSQTRWDIERQVLKELNDRSEALGKEVHWKIFAYDSQLRNLGLSNVSDKDVKNDGVQTDWQSILPAIPIGPITDVGKPISEVLSAVTDPPLMAVVWLGDGAQTSRSDTTDAQQSARQLSQLDIPLYLIGIGPKSGSEQTRDQILEEIPDQSEAFAKNVVPVRGSLRAIGLQNRELTVGIYLIEESSKPTLLNQVSLKPSQIDQSLPFQLAITAPSPGAYQLLVKAEGVDGEATLLNNERTCFLNVRDSGSRILLLEGQPLPEQKYIRRALADSPDLQIDRKWILESTRDQWPMDLSEWLKNDLYDCIVLGDVDSSALGPKTLARIVELVQSGVGLVMTGGYHAYGSGGYQDSPMASIVPFEMDSVRQLFGKPLNDSGHWIGEIQLEPRGTHPITDLSKSLNAMNVAASSTEMRSPANNAEAWKQLKPLLGANRWRNIREGPGIQILANGPENQPLIISSDAGKGRVLCLAFDSTYRWCLQGKTELHRQFWRQAVLWTMRREETEEGLRLEMPKRTLALGESSTYTLFWSPGSKQAPMPKDIELRWSVNGDDRGPLVPQKTGPNSMTGEIIQVAKPGRYEISARATNSDGQPLSTKMPFIVVDMAIEKLQASPDWPLINQLAKLSETAGGRSIAPESTDEIFKLLAERRRTATVASVKTFRLGDGLIDSWLTFVLIALLWSVQWSLRKAWNLP